MHLHVVRQNSYRRDHPKATAALGVGVTATALFLSRGRIAGLFKSEPLLPSALLKTESQPGTLAHMLDDMVRSGRVTTVAGENGFFVLKPVGELNPALIVQAESRIASRVRL